ncbi:MAG: hypothetical protein FWC09_00375 [Lachnospiraceae bacterium]|nr:hypothetical protein [Lachnospiraceae bacterium]
MKIYKIYSLMGLCYVYSMNPVENELMEEVYIKLPDEFAEITRKNGMRGIVGPDGFIATMFSGPDPMIFNHQYGGGENHTFQVV